MTDSVIVIDYDPFAMESRISKYQDGKMQYDLVSSDLEEIGTSVTKLAHTTGIFSVKIHAPFRVTDELTNIIQKYENNISEYSNEPKIEIEEI